MSNEPIERNKLPGSWDGYSFGEGDFNVIYLHDALGAVDSWSDFPYTFFDEFKHKGYVFSRLGHGYSKGEKIFERSDYLSLEAVQLHDFITYHKIDNPILIGSSDGGSIALLYASKYPCRAVVTIAGHYKVEGITSQGVADTMKAEITAKIVNGLNKIHPTQASTLVSGWQNTWTSKEYQSWNIHMELRKIMCDVLVLQGKQDPYASDAHALEIAEMVNGKSYVGLIENAGHFPHLEKREIVINQIKKFFKDISLCEN